MLDMATIDGRTLEHNTLEHIRIQAVRRVVEDGEFAQHRDGELWFVPHHDLSLVARF